VGDAWGTTLYIPTLKITQLVAFLFLLIPLCVKFDVWHWMLYYFWNGFFRFLLMPFLINTPTSGFPLGGNPPSKTTRPKHQPEHHNSIVCFQQYVFTIACPRFNS
jgi:hypothetical protein